MKKAVLLLCFCFSLTSLLASTIKIEVNAGDFARKDCIVAADVAKMNLTKNNGVVLFEKVDGEKRPVECQLVWADGKNPVLYWVLDGDTPAGASRYFVASSTDTVDQSGSMTVKDTNEALVLSKDGKAVLQYNYTTTFPPEGVHPAYRRSGYIHPAYSPSGNVLTRIQPRDHYHHYGIWNPWTRVEYDGKMYDLWNLRDMKGTVRARGYDRTYQGDICAGYKAHLYHYIFTPEGEKAIMDETWNVKVYNLEGGFLWDFESELHPSTDLPVILRAYRYAGFGWRGPQEWTRHNSEMFTSEGNTRQQIDGTNVRWIYVTGQCDNGRSGLLFMSHPQNRKAPEPVRIWDENANGGRGDTFIGLCPTKNEDWTLEAGGRYKLCYRVLSYDGEMTKERADRLWNDFANPPVVKVK